MSKFTPTVTREYDFHGEKVKATFSRLNRKDMLKLMPLFTKLKSDDAEGTNEVLNVILDLLPKYVVIEGLTDAAGEPVGIETVADELYFMDLSADICMDLIEESTVMIGGKAKKT